MTSSESARRHDLDALRIAPWICFGVTGKDEADKVMINPWPRHAVPGESRLARLSLVKLLQEHLQQEQDGVAQTHREQTLHLLTIFICLRTEPSC